MRTIITAVVLAVLATAAGCSGDDDGVDPAVDKIVFQSCGSGSEVEEEKLPSCDIYLVGADGTGLTPLTTAGGMRPSWAPDGRRIAFTSCTLTFSNGDVQTGSSCDINTVGADGSDLRNLTRNEKDSFANFTEDLTSGVWSPDGKRIAFTSCSLEAAGDLESGSCHLAVMNDDGSDPHKVAEQAEHVAWSPDSKRIAVTSHEDGTWDIYSVAIGDEEVTNLTGSGDGNTNFEEVRWSPDGSRVAYVSIAPVPAGAEDNYLGKWDIYVMDPDGSNVTNLTNSPSEITERISYSSLDWSPGGEEIAFVGGGNLGNDISIMKSDGTGVRCLTCDHPYGAGYDVAWSPDGTRLLFTSDHDGNTDPYVMNADGTGLVRLTDMPGQDGFASWSPVVASAPAGARPGAESMSPTALGPPPEGKILFFSDRDGELRRYVMNTDGSGISPIGGAPGVWSADGRRFASTSCSPGPLDRNGNLPQSCAIYVSDGPDSTWRLLVKNGNALSWSPDGKRLAFLRGRKMPQGERVDDIYVIQSDGSGLTNVTGSFVDFQYSLEFRWLEWSPDGRTIAATVYRDSGDEHIYLVHTDGSGLAPAFNREQGARAFGPRWSPDGSRIAFSYCPPVPGGDYAPSDCDIAAISADGSGFDRLATDGDSPAWSPDGKQIAFESGRDGDNREIYVMNADGSDQRRLTQTGSFEHSPAWSPDGKYLAFYASGRGNVEVYVVRADATGLTNLSSHPAEDRDPVWVPGDFSLTAPAGQPPVPTFSPPTVPVPLTPGVNAVVPQKDPAYTIRYEGCVVDPNRAGMSVFFDWTDSSAEAGLAGYELAVGRGPVELPYLDRLPGESQLVYLSCGARIADGALEKWQWRVRAQDTLGNFSEWSPPVTFEFAPYGN